ncbi:MAG: chemotaxis-specific protein-glutamate methyltransferase CheB [Lachnospiraceae bacterium]|nr:chemotaxis-specific protein-glutamate methyltransferase CheB [Lachnospiraceae bacterium]MDD7178628.1 chemotaxis-specific protein-glutamate methyltransferase CheB [bacterium]MDY5518433.1 chemotaxis-specific protein-glutamate methyltransferase CheB [Lachnospiraceae bacterium]
MKKNILVVDDSALMRRVICDIINSDNRFQAIDTCCDGLQAYEKLKTKRYDAVLLDVYMPRMDGLQLLERIQTEHIEATVIMVSTLTTEDASVTVRAMELGAVDFVTKPENIIEAKGHDFRKRLLDMIQAVLHMDEPQIRATAVRERTRPTASVMVAPKSDGTPRRRMPAPRRGCNRIVALACSTGGPKALHTVLPALDPGMDAPMVLVQHMPTGFTKSLADRLNELSKVTVKEAEEGETLEKGVVYIAPGGRHLEVVCGANGSHKVHLSDAPAIGGLKPCANIMYQSLKNSRYDEITCVVLTGMGADGTAGIEQLDKSKPIHVIAQNAQTCVVYGMPRAVAEAGLVDEVVPLESIANTIIKNVGVK